MTRALITDGYVDLDRGEVVRGSGVVHLTTNERRMLAYLAQRPGQDVERDQLRAEIWGHGPRVASRVADTTASRLRRKIERVPAEPRHVMTVHGIGYRFEPATPSGERAPTGEVVLCVAQPAPGTDEAHWLQHVATSLRARAGYLVHLEPDRAVVVLEDAEAVRALTQALHDGAEVAVGVARGVATVLTDPVGGRTLYGGDPFHRASALARLAHPGQTLADADLAPDAPSLGRLALPPNGVRRPVVRMHGPAREVATSATPVGSQTRLVGRASELQQALDAIAGGQRVVAWVGPPGVGKTSLGTRLGQQLASDGSRRLVWVGLAEATAELHGVEALADALGTTADLDAVGALLRDGGPAVVVLDELEGLKGALDAQVARWVDQAPGVVWVLTSRERPEVPGAAVIELGPLALDDAVSLLVELVDGLSVTDDLRALAEALDGLPLALELAAPRLRLMSPAALLQRVQARLDALARRRTGRERHRSLQAALGASWALLDPAERRVLAQCSVFSGPFDLAAAEAVVDPGEGAPWFVDLLQSLRDKHLLQGFESPRRPGTPSFRWLTTVRQFAVARLEDHPEAALVTRDRHAAWVVGRMGSAPEVGPSGLELTLLPDALAASSHALDQGHDETAALAAQVAATIAFDHGRAGDALTQLQRVDGDEVPTALRARLQRLQARFLNRLGNIEAAMQTAQRAQELADVSGDRSEQGCAAHQRGIILTATGDTQAALEALEQAVEHLDPVHDRVRRLAVRHQIAATRAERGELWAARAGFVSLLAEGESPLSLYALTGLGMLEATVGLLDEADVHLAEAVTLAEDEGTPMQLANACSLRATALIGLGRLADARSVLERALGLYDEAGVAAFQGVCRTQLAWLCLLEDDPSGALAELQRADVANGGGGEPRLRAGVEAIRSEALAATGDLVGAQAAVQIASGLTSQMDDPTVRAHVAIHVGIAEVALGHVEAARRALAVAEDVARTLEVRPAAPIAQEARRLRRALHDASGTL